MAMHAEKGQDLQANRGVRLIAFYLPQFHPIPENDAWWGKGFTEWTNVAKAKPLFRGHHQPDLPSDLGFYDLRVPEVRQAQAELARSHGIEGFCYWHYWFGNGKRLLGRVFDEVLAAGRPDFPFCLGWANETWTGTWHGLKNKILISQEYPGEKDYVEHLNWLLPAFRDPRYIRVDGRPLFLVFRGDELPDSVAVCELWRRFAKQNGLPGLYIAGLFWRGENPNDLGYDASIPSEPGMFRSLGTLQDPNDGLSLILRARRKLRGWLERAAQSSGPGTPEIYSYAQCAERYCELAKCPSNVFPCVVPNWDNTPRCGPRGFVFPDANPELYRKVLRKALRDVAGRPFQERLVFIKSWNEWAEGNYLEPSLRFGHEYLKVTREEVLVGHGNSGVSTPTQPAG